jgi:hypothetical protein
MEMTNAKVLGLMKFIGEKVPRYALKQKLDSFAIPYSDKLMDQDGNVRDGWYDDKTLQKISILNTKLDGTATEYSKGSKIRSAELKGGSMNGWRIRYGEDHEKNYVERKEMMKDNILDGPFYTYFRNGSLSSEGYFVNNKPYGEWKDYASSGFVRSITIFENGVPVSKKDFHPNGALECDYPIEDGKIGNEYVKYHDDGKTISMKVEKMSTSKRYHYYDQKGKEISADTYDKNNKLVMHTRFRNGEVHTTHYDERGREY